MREAGWTPPLQAAPLHECQLVLHPDRSAGGSSSPQDLTEQVFLHRPKPFLSNADVGFFAWSPDCTWEPGLIPDVMEVAE